MHRRSWFAILLVSHAAVFAQAQPPKLQPGKPAAAPAAPAPVWFPDYELARSQARDRKLDLLMVFLGSAPTEDGKKLELEVLGKPEFLSEVVKGFVLAKFDLGARELPEVLQKQNAWLLTKYPSPRLPMVWLTDGAGQAYAKTGYVPGGAKAFAALLEGKRQGNQKAAAALARAATLRGIERAKVLAEALRCLDDDIVATTHFRAMLEIIGLDADGAAGLKPEFDAIARDAAARPTLHRLQAELGPLVQQQKWPELDAEIAAARAQHPGERWADQYLTFLQGIHKADGDRDHAAALLLFTQAAALAPRSELAGEIERRGALAKNAVEAEARAEAAGAKAKGGAPPKKK